MPTDPAAMIAMALKKKFAHRIREESNEEDAESSWAEKENEMLERKKAKMASNVSTEPTVLSLSCICIICVSSAICSHQSLEFTC